MSGPVIVWGAGGHAHVVADVLRLRGLTIAGFIDDVTPSRRGEPFLGAQVLGGRDALGALRAAGIEDAIVAIGDNEARAEACSTLRASGFLLVTAVHPATAVAASSRIGAGTVIAAMAAVAPGATVGDCVIVNTAASVDHDASVADGAHLAPGVRLGGWAVVERCAFVGMGSIVGDRARVGARALVGAGSLVLRDVPPDVVAYGSPARVIRPR